MLAVHCHGKARRTGTFQPNATTADHQKSNVSPYKTSVPIRGSRTPGLDFDMISCLDSPLWDQSTKSRQEEERRSFLCFYFSSDPTGKELKGCCHGRGRVGQGKTRSAAKVAFLARPALHSSSENAMVALRKASASS